MHDNAEHLDAPETAPVPAGAAPAQGAAVDGPAPAAHSGGGPFFLLVAGAAIAGAALTMAVLGGTRRPADSSPRAASPARSVMVEARTRPEPPAVFPRWNQAHEGRWISNHRRSIAYEIDAVAPVSVWLRHVRPTLVVRCLANATDVFVFTDSAARIEPRDDNHTVRVGFDAEPDATERWPDSADHDALFAPNGLLLAQKLTRARAMRFAFTPHNADPVVARFDVAGFDAVARTMARTCGWN